MKHLVSFHPSWICFSLTLIFQTKYELNMMTKLMKKKGNWKNKFKTKLEISFFLFHRQANCLPP